MISVGRILEGAFGVFRENLVAVAIWGGIYFAFNLAFTLAMSPVIQNRFGAGVSVTDTTQLAAAAIPIWLLSLLLGIVGVILYTASMRSVLRPDTGGIAFLRLGVDELRMLGLCLIFGIAGFILLLVAGLITGLLLTGLETSTDSDLLKVILSLLIGLVLFGTVAFFVIRFSLAFPLTLHRGAFAIGEAWTLSRGHFWKLFAAVLVVTLIGLVASVAVNLVTAGSHFADLLATLSDTSAAADGTPVQVVLPQRAGAGSFDLLVFLQSIGGGAVAAIWFALSGGSTATAARLLVADEFSDAEEVFG